MTIWELRSVPSFCHRRFIGEPLFALSAKVTEAALSITGMYIWLHSCGMYRFSDASRIIEVGFDAWRDW